MAKAEKTMNGDFLFHPEDCIVKGNKMICWNCATNQAVVVDIKPDNNAVITQEELFELFNKIQKNALKK